MQPNRVSRITLKGTSYLLRTNTRPGDVARHFECMKSAASAGLAPAVHYANPEDRTSIVDFIEAVPFPPATAMQLIPAALRKLHALPPFPTSPFNTTCTFLLNASPMLESFLTTFRDRSILPTEETNQLLNIQQQLSITYSQFEPDLVPSHNDLFKPDNMLYDGTRLWFIDFEAAFQNDRYADLAAISNLLLTNDEEERTFLTTYFNQPPTGHQLQRLRIMRQLCHAFYAMAFLTNPSIDPSQVQTNYQQLQADFWSGTFKLDDDQSKVFFGLTHWHHLRDSA